MRISNKVGGKEGRVDDRQTVCMCDFYSDSVIGSEKETENEELECGCIRS